MIGATGSWALAIPVAALAIAVVGLLVERVFLRSLGSTPLRQVLLTVGFAFLFQQAALDIWGVATTAISSRRKRSPRA